MSYYIATHGDDMIEKWIRTVGDVDTSLDDVALSLRQAKVKIDGREDGEAKVALTKKWSAAESSFIDRCRAAARPTVQAK